MNLRKFRDTFALYSKNLRGWRTNRKIVVIESDDWGSIRMPSKQVYERCLKQGYRVDQNPFEQNDALESESDLEFLFELLYSFKDHNGNSPIFTANCVVGNPDFEQIKNDKFETYSYELVTHTFKRYPKHSGSFRLWKEGTANRVFNPQIHAREHLNVSKFMSALQQGNKDVHFGFEHGMPGCIPQHTDKGRNRYVEATHYTTEKDKQEKLEIVLDGIDRFDQLLGYRSESYIPTNYKWSPDFNEKLYENSVKYLQGRPKMIEPQTDGTTKVYKTRQGQNDPSGLINLNRNVRFEPTLSYNGDQHLNETLKEIAIAFRMNKPAVIDSHRINYCGYIHPENRDNNLNLLSSLLDVILKKWPEVEFMSSDQLGRCIESTE